MLIRSSALAIVLGLAAARAAAQTTLFDVSGTPGTGFGTSLDTLGDLDGDGFGEFLIGAPVEPNGTLTGAGLVTVYSGADAHVLFTVRGTRQGEHVGSSASAAGDVDADGVPDFAVGADGARPSNFRQAGRVQVFSGRDGSVLHTWSGERVADFFGMTVDELGDLDHDGHDDVLVGASGRLAPNGDWVGALLVYSGRDGSVLVRAYGDRVGGLLGEQGTSALGDVNGDGRADFLGTQIGNQMVTRVFSGLDGRELHRLTFVIPSGWFRVDAHLDANLDGAGDYLLGLTGGAGQLGEAQLFSGRDGSQLGRFVGERINVGLGGCVRGAGDLDGDGYGDFVVGVGFADGPAGVRTGELRAYSGRDFHDIGRVFGDRPDQRLGEGLVGGGRDVNGDGSPELMISVREILTGALSVEVISVVPRGLEPFGGGTPGCAGALRLCANGSPSVGNAAFALHGYGLGPEATGLMTSEFAVPAGVPLHNALFHVDPARVLTHTRLPDPDLHGSLVAALPIPADPALLGTTLVFQLVSFFPAGACTRRISTSPGLTLTFH
ncbi:MAG: hypothetical protein ABL998_02235 [Planctomycetota bacterium]